MVSSIWFLAVSYDKGVDTKDAFVDIEDGTGIIDCWDIESIRNTTGDGCVIMLTLFTAVPVDDRQFLELKKQLGITVNGDTCVILKQTSVDT